MNIINDDAAQTSVEMLLLFGGIIVVVIAAALFYRNYLSGLGTITNGTDLNNTLNGINGLATKLQ
ncbi:MAG: class III signal peptide-containing protein [Methanobacterium sp.]|uniref:class III signal peptide-containing protein n=1 Tax=Methanobacterium sp. TaxID=2164 RepID=UPI003C770CDF